MKTFLIKAFFFLLPFIVVYSFIEYKLSVMPNGYNQKKSLLEQQIKNKGIEVLALGPSCTLNAINPEYLSHNTFNLAYYNQTIYYDKRLVLKNIDRIPSLRLVIITISPFALYRQLNGGKEEWRDYFYYRVWGIKFKNMPLLDSRKYSYISLYTLDKTKEFIKEDFKPELKLSNLWRPIGYSATGYAKNDSSGHLQKLTESLGKDHADIFNKSFFDLSEKDKEGKEIKYIVNDLEEFIVYLQQKNIRVAFITTPFYYTCTKNINKRIFAMNDSIMHQICNKYTCPYVNYIDDKRFTIDDFWDVEHLSDNGATKFSKIIDSEIIKPAFK